MLNTYDFEVRVAGALTPGLTPTIAAAYKKDLTGGSLVVTTLASASSGYPVIAALGLGLYTLVYDSSLGVCSVVINANSASTDPNEQQFTVSLFPDAAAALAAAGLGAHALSPPSLSRAQAIAILNSGGTVEYGSTTIYRVADLPAAFV